MAHFKQVLFHLLDPVLALIAIPSAICLKVIRRLGLFRLPLSKATLLQIGIVPIRRHYYEPLFDGRDLLHPLDWDRNLPGIDWNVAGQLAMLDGFSHGEAFRALMGNQSREKEGAFHFGNGNFESGDAEYWYQFIRSSRPARIIEIGSGNSTLLARMAIEGALTDAPGYTCEHICIEPFEMPWLESSGVKVIRSRVEEIDISFFEQLQGGDILFVDSSHVIRPQGDVLFEFLELLPRLKVGVVVHIHDIFSPKDYPATWITGEVRFWNEQYLLEAFLSHNPQWQIIGALNYLHHHHPEALSAKCPFLVPTREPGSFYIRRVA